MNDILKNWGLSGEKITQIDTIHKSSWNIRDSILKYNPNIAELSQCIKLSNLLSLYKIPLAEYIKTADGNWTTPDGKYCLMKKLNGNHIDFYEHPEMINVLGQELAKLHGAFLKIESEAECKDSNYIEDWQNYIKPGLVNVSNDIINFIEDIFFNLYKDLPKQLIHRDVHSQNVLFDNGKLSGWLDFDISCRNVRIFDMAYLLAGLLVGKTNSPVKIKIWNKLYHELLLGYESVNSLSDTEKEALPYMMMAIELLFVTFWNNYGNIEQRDEAIIVVEWLYENYGKNKFAA